MKRIYFCLILLVFLFLQTCVKTPTTLVNNNSQHNVFQNIPLSKIPLEKDFLLNDVSVSLFKQKGVLATYHHNSGESITVFGPIIGELISMGNGSYFSKNYYKTVWLSADKINSLVSYIDEKGYPVASVVNESTTLFYERDEKNKSVNTWAYYPDGKTEVINDTITSFYIKSISSGLSEDSTKRIVFSSVYNSVNYSCLPKSPVRKFFLNSCGSNIAKTIKEDPTPNELKKVECDINCQNIVASKSNVVEANSFALVKTKIKEATKINSSIYNIVSSIVRPSKETPTFIPSESYNQGNSVPTKTISINGNIELLTRSMGSPDSPSSNLIPSSYFLVGLTLEAVGSNLKNPVIAKTQNKGTSYSFSNVSIPSGTKYLLINVYTVYTSGKSLPSSAGNSDTYSLGNILRKAVVDIDNKDSTVNIDISSTATALLISSTNIEGIKGSKKFASFEVEKQKIVKLLTDKVESGYSVIINPNVLESVKESAKELVTSTRSLSYIRINLSDISSSFQTKSISSVLDKIYSLSLYISGNDNNIDVEKKLTKEDISIYYSQSDGFITVPVELPDDKRDFRVTGVVTDDQGKNYQGDGVFSKSIGNIRLYLENINPCFNGKFVASGSVYQDFIATTPPMKTLDGTGCKQSFIEKGSYSANSKNEATGLLIGKLGQDTFFVGGSIYKKWMEKGVGGTTTTGFPIANKIEDEYQYFEKTIIYSLDNFQNTHIFYQDNLGKNINYNDKFLSEIFVPYQKQKLSKEIVLLESELQFREMLLYQMEIIQKELESNIDQQKQELLASVIGMISLISGSRTIEKIETIYDTARGDFVSVSVSLFASRIEEAVSYFKQEAKSIKHATEVTQIITRTKVLRLFIDDIDSYYPYLSRYIKGEKDFTKLLDYYSKNGKDGFESIKRAFDNPIMKPNYSGKLGEIAQSKIGNSYDELTNILNEGGKFSNKDLLNLEVHHLIDQRIAKAFGMTPKQINEEIPSIVLKKCDHENCFTRPSLDKVFPIGTNYRNMSKAQLKDGFREIYKDYPQLLDEVDKFIEKNASNFNLKMYGQ